MTALHRKIFCLTLAVIFLMAGRDQIPSASAQQAGGMSTDEFLEYTLAGLRKKMDKAIEQNQQLSAKNDSLEKRMLFLQKEMREFSDQKMILMEQAVKLRESIKLGADENETVRKQANNSRERKQHLQLEIASLEKQVQSMDAERKYLVEKVDEVKGDLMRVQEGVRVKDKGDLLQYYGQEKYKFMELVAQARARIQEKEDRLDMLDLETARKLSLREKELLARQSLEEKVSSLRLKLRESRDKYALLERSRIKIQDQSKEAAKNFEKGLSAMRDYSKALKLTTADMRDAKVRIDNGFEFQQKILKDHIALLQEENELLFLKNKELENRLLLKRSASTQEHAQILVRNEHDQLVERARLIKQEKMNTENNIAAQKKISDSSQRDLERLKKELLEIENDLKVAKAKTEQLRKTEFGKKREELKELLLQKKQNVVNGDAEIKVLGQSFADQAAALKNFQEQREALSGRLAGLNEDFKKAQELEKDLTGKKQEFSDRAEESSKGAREELKILKLRKKALSGSLDVARKKYQAGEAQAGVQDSEFAQLEQYLSVLKKENASLKEKAVSLQ